MRAALLLVVGCIGCVGCVDPVAARWQLDHDHIVAARATPPRVMPGEVAILDALVAHAGAATSIDSPEQADAPLAPEALQGMVAEEAGVWQLTVPSAETLAAARSELGLAASAAIPLDIVMQFAGPEPMVVKKTVWLGDRADNPTMPAVFADAQPMPDELAIALGRDVHVEVLATGRVSWLTSCGELFQDDLPRAFVRAREPCEGELAVVVRDDMGGVVWQVRPIRAQ